MALRPQIHRNIQGQRLRVTPAGSSCPQWNDKTIEQIHVHFIHDTTNVEFGLVASSCWQTREGTRPQFVNQHNSDQNMSTNMN